MAGIREVLQAFGRRDGVDAVILLGHDGLPIDSHTADGADPEVLAALIPSVIQSCDQLGRHAARGDFHTAVLEYAGGYSVVCNLSRDAKLLIVVRPRTNIGPLLYDIARHRAELAGLV
jgi:predicted regulator of Ras-like GTPase activity (Roadblock/LC7/MglB family)